MKNKPLWITVILLTIVTIAFYQKEVNPVVENNKKISNYNTSVLSINLETKAGSGIYEEATDSKWPTSGYTFNTELSRCEQGSQITWSEETKKITVSSSKSDKCYVYFDKIPTFADHIIGLYTTQGSNNLYHHDGTILATEVNEESGVNIGDVLDANDGSYRYAGSYETTNNWVCFGTDATTCDDEHLYRIIGVFNNQVKLIKAYEGTQTSLGIAAHGNGSKNTTYYKGKLELTPGYYWSGSKSNGSQDWTKSTLNTDILNGTYLTILGITWSDKIADTEWKISGHTWSYIKSQNSATAYQNEIVNPQANTTTNRKVGLMYVSDYGFAANKKIGQ